MDHSLLDLLRGVAFTIQIVPDGKFMVYDHEVPVIEENIRVYVVHESPWVFPQNHLQLIPKHERRIVDIDD